MARVITLTEDARNGNPDLKALRELLYQCGNVRIDHYPPNQKGEKNVIVLDDGKKPTDEEILSSPVVRRIENNVNFAF